MKDQQDQFWDAVLAAETPSAEEMARAEADLRELEPAAGLPQAQIDAMVRATVNPAGREMAAPRRSGNWSMVKLAAIVSLSLALAWGVLKFVWPEGFDPLRTLDYSEAILVATEPHRIEEHRLAAINEIERSCHHAFPALRRLCAENVDEPIRDHARRIRDQLVTLLTRGADRAPEAADLGLVQATADACNELASIEQRQQALAHLGHLCVQGMRAFAAAELQTAEGNVKRAIFRQRLLRDLTQ